MWSSETAPPRRGAEVRRVVKRRKLPVGARGFFSFFTATEDFLRRRVAITAAKQHNAATFARRRGEPPRRLSFGPWRALGVRPSASRQHLAAHPVRQPVRRRRHPNQVGKRGLRRHDAAARVPAAADGAWSRRRPRQGRSVTLVEPQRTLGVGAGGRRRATLRPPAERRSTPAEPAVGHGSHSTRPLHSLGSILVPFPVESCLSGVAPASSATLVAQMWYRLVFDAAVADGAKTLLHFGAVDWQATVYLNGLLLRHDGRLGKHSGRSARRAWRVRDTSASPPHRQPHGRVRRLRLRRDRPAQARRRRDLPPPQDGPLQITPTSTRAQATSCWCTCSTRPTPAHSQTASSLASRDSSEMLRDGSQNGRRRGGRQAARLRRRPARRRHLHPVVRDLADGLDGGGAPVVHFHAQDRPGVHHERQGHRLCRGRRRHHPGPVRGGRQGRDDGG